MLSYIIPFLILLTIVVFVHEYGHYYFARKYGVGVTTFSIGIGHELFGYTDKIAQDGDFQRSLSEVMLNFSVIMTSLVISIEMSYAKNTTKKIKKNLLL